MPFLSKSVALCILLIVAFDMLVRMGLYCENRKKCKQNSALKNKIH